MNSKQNTTSFHAANLLPKDELSIQILRERAKAFAIEDAVVSKKSDKISYICFKLGSNEYYGIPYDFANEVIGNIDITKLPGAQGYIAGILNRRGKLLTLLDLKKFFQLDISSTDKQYYLIIIEARGVSVGVLADQIVGSAAYDADDMAAMQSYEGAVNPKYTLGLDQGKITILNIENILSDLKGLLKQQTI